MAINIKKYVDITSGVGGGASVAQRSLGLRMFTTNATLPVDTLVEFTTLEDVGTYFTTTSEEYYRALQYFGFVSKSIQTPQKISFFAWDHAGSETLTDCLTKSAQLSNNFGSFAFIDSLALTLTQVEEIATWNAAQNVMFMFCQSVTAANASAWSTALIGFAGTALILTAGATHQYPELMPSVVLAATDYNAVNGTQNYMFQQFDSLTPTVTTTTLSNTYDTERINYLGQTQTAGQYLAFFQRGDLMGGSTAPIAMNVYANEMWFKDALTSKLMQLLLALPKVSANTRGKAQIMTVLQGAINLAVNNGTISVGKTLTDTQILYVTNQSGDNNAWQKVQSIGYWVTVSIQSYTGASGATEYKAVYTIIYSKDDCVRSISGSHVLI